MKLPEWARRALVSADPESEHGQWLAGMADLLRKRWRDMQADAWAVPEWHASYSRGHDIDHVTRADVVRKRILETALDLACDKHHGKDPRGAAQAAKELEKMNEQIVDVALQLADLFGKRSELLCAHELEDQSDWHSEDPFDFWDAFEAAMQQTEFRGWAYTAQHEIDAFLRIAREQSRPGPGWPDLLGQLAFRPQEAVSLTDAGDVAATKPKTKHTEWSSWSLQLMGALDTGWQGTYPDGFLLGCLSAGQLASLVEIVFDVPVDARINDEQMRKLRQRYAERNKKDDSASP